MKHTFWYIQYSNFGTPRLRWQNDFYSPPPKVIHSLSKQIHSLKMPTTFKGSKLDLTRHFLARGKPNSQDPSTINENCLPAHASPKSPDLPPLSPCKPSGTLSSAPWVHNRPTTGNTKNFLLEIRGMKFPSRRDVSSRPYSTVSPLWSLRFWFHLAWEFPSLPRPRYFRPLFVLATFCKLRPMKTCCSRAQGNGYNASRTWVRPPAHQYGTLRSSSTVLIIADLVPLALRW